ncbi:MAG TPA: hypothetical protein VJ770_03345 [Stellaceae bacterium]|nr:hypothetical protein [Stellaceae bacterium]
MRLPAACYLLALLAFSAAGCQPNAPLRYRTDACLAPAGATGDACGVSSLEEHRLQNHPGQSFLLGFVEVDDQGRPYIRNQIPLLFNRIEQEARYRDLSIVVFVHGWKHNDAPTDDNVVAFRRLLRQVAEIELQRAPTYWPKRKVVGIYIGWRGLSFGAGEIGQDLTFWTRMAAAHRVAEGAVREVLARAKALRDAVDASSWPGHQDHRSTRLITIGHSFGGLIVYTALSQYFIDQAVQSEAAPFARSLLPAPAQGGPDKGKEIAGYGDLVVVVNPAIEATRFEPIRELMQNRRSPGGFAPNQNPVFVEVTSDADWATGIAFPAGRLVNTTVESFTGQGERQEAMAALGHYPLFWTHRLAGPAARADQNPTPPPIDVEQECRDFARFTTQERADGYLKPGWRRRYRTGAVLTANANFDPNDPFWIITTDQSMIEGHNDIEEPVFVDFIRQLYDDLVRLKEDVPCRTTPGAARKIG